MLSTKLVDGQPYRSHLRWDASLLDAEFITCQSTVMLPFHHFNLFWICCTTCSNSCAAVDKISYRVVSLQHQSLKEVRTLCQNLRIKKEDIRVQDAIQTCGYPEWSFQKARRQMKQMKPKKKKKTGCSSDKTFSGDSLCRENFRDSSQDHEKIQCTLCYETMGYSQECLGTPQRS